jgi:hypothetical protein
MFRKLTWALAPAAFMWATAPAHAACDQSGNVVTCSGASSTGFGTGVENNLSLTVVPSASITVPSNVKAIDLGDSNTAVNNGTISVGDNAMGMAGHNNNSLTNAGTIAIGSNASGIFILGNNNTVSNTGAITGAGVGIDLLGTGNTASNSGTITLTGTGSTGIAGNGTGATITNFGTITVGSGSAGTNGQGVFLQDNNTLTNSGTITNAGDSGVGVSVWGNNNTVNNSGAITATGSTGIALGIGGIGDTIVNSGTIKGGANGFSLFSLGATGISFTNNGTLDGSMFFVGSGNTLTNNGLVTITDPATALTTFNIGFGGTFIQSAQGTLALRVDNAGHHDSLGALQVQLDGTLRAVVQAGLYQTTTTYANVVQGPVTGQFAAVISSSAFFNATATYNSTSVHLTLTRSGFGAVAGETANQRAVGNALEAGYSPSLTGAAATFYS